MEFDNFLLEPRWKILEIIANNPSSPVKISEAIGTSVAYVSQQLKLLEAAKIVSRKRTKASDKGQPRIIYSISQDVFHITALMDKFPRKRKMSPTEKQKIVLKIWMIEKESLSYLSEKLFWKIEPRLEDVEDLFINIEKNEIILVSKKSSMNTIVQNFLKEVTGKISCKILQNGPKNTSGLYHIYHSSEENEEKEEAK